MRLHQVGKDLFINLDRVLRVEIESKGYGREYIVRWTLQGNTTHVQAQSFKDHAAAVQFLADLSRICTTGLPAPVDAGYWVEDDRVPG